MLIFPAIDLKDGKCVRLYQGDYNKVTVYDEDPVRVAKLWKTEGAEYLHLVDLDGAKSGQLINLKVIEQIVTQSGLKVEVGGGIRDEEALNRLLSLGVVRVILGTAALRNPVIVGQLCRKYGEQIVIGIDARNGLVAVEGWTETSTVTAQELALKLTEQGATRFIYTDIARDGTLSEPNYSAFAEFKASAQRPVIASGGVSKLDHVFKLRELGAEGVIVGKALYTGDLKLAQLLENA